VAGIRQKMRERAVTPSAAAPSAPAAPIKAPAMNITLGSVGTISLAAVLTTWDQAFKFLFGTDPAPEIRERIFIVTLAAVVIIVVADMLARAIASRGERSGAVPMADGWKAILVTEGEDEGGFVAVASRDNGANLGGVDVLLWKEGKGATWHRSETVRLSR